MKMICSGHYNKGHNYGIFMMALKDLRFYNTKTWLASVDEWLILNNCQIKDTSLLNWLFVYSSCVFSFTQASQYAVFPSLSFYKSLSKHIFLKWPAALWSLSKYYIQLSTFITAMTQMFLYTINGILLCAIFKYIPSLDLVLKNLKTKAYLTHIKVK